MMGQLIDREINNVAVAPHGVGQWKKSWEDSGRESMNTMKKSVFSLFTKNIKSGFSSNLSLQLLLSKYSLFSLSGSKAHWKFSNLAVALASLLPVSTYIIFFAGFYIMES